MTDHDQIHLRTLGELTVASQAKAVALGARKHYGVLVYLALHQGSAITRDRLANLFWHKSTAKRSRHSLSQTLYQLRRQLPGLLLESNNLSVWLPRRSVLLDVGALESAIASSDCNQVLRLYRGPFLDGFFIPASPEFEEWQEIERSRIEHLVRRFLKREMARAKERYDWDFVDRISAIVDFSTFQGERRGRGRTAHHRVANLTQPSHEAGVVLHSQPSHSRISGVPRTTVDSGRPTRPVIVGSNPVFVGRRAEMETLTTIWKEISTGHAALAVISGEAGIGKTALAHHFLRAVSVDQPAMITSKCHASELGVPYSGIVDGLAVAVTPDVLTALPRIWADTLIHVLPELDSRREPAAQLPPLDADGGQRRILEAIVRALQVIASDRPLLWLIDNLHWVDGSSCSLVHYVLRRLSTHPFLIITTLRSEVSETNSHLKQLLSPDTDAFEHYSTYLGPLSRQDLQELVDNYLHDRHLAFDPATRERIIEQSAGRPLFAIETIKALESGDIALSPPTDRPSVTAAKVMLPRSLESFLAQRLESMDAPARQIAGAMAVLARDTQLDLLLGISGMTADDAVGAIEQLISKGVVVAVDDRLEFSHDLFSESVRRSMTPARARNLHRRAALVLKQSSHADPGVLAHHCANGGLKRLALRCALRAAKKSERSYSHDEVEYYLQIALNNAPTTRIRTALLERLANLYYNLRRVSDADRLYAELENIDRELGTNPDRLLRARVRRLHIETRTVRTEELLAQCIGLRDESLATGSDSISDILEAQASLCYDLGKRDELCESLPVAIAIARRSRDKRRGIQALQFAAKQIAVLVSANDGHVLALEALDRARTMGDNELIVRAHNVVGMAKYLQGNLYGALEHYEAGLSLAETVGAVWLRVLFLGQRSLVFQEQGRYEEAREGFTNSLMQAQQHDLLMETVMSRLNLAENALVRSERELALSHCHEILDLREGRTAWWASVAAFGMQGLCALEQGHLSEAFKCRREILKLMGDRKFWMLDCSPSEILLARLATLEGQVKAAVSRLEMAISAFADTDFFCRSRLRLERARLLVDRETEEAEREVSEVHACAREVGARPLAERAEEILDRIRFRRA